MKTPSRDALIALASEMGVDSTETALVATALLTSDFRPWLVQQGLIEQAAAAKLSDGAISFFASGVMAERKRRARVS